MTLPRPPGPPSLDTGRGWLLRISWPMPACDCPHRASSLHGPEYARPTSQPFRRRTSVPFLSLPCRPLDSIKKHHKACKPWVDFRSHHNLDWQDACRERVESRLRALSEPGSALPMLSPPTTSSRASVRVAARVGPVSNDNQLSRCRTCRRKTSLSRQRGKMHHAEEARMYIGASTRHAHSAGGMD